jgi:hypothetical protein
MPASNDKVIPNIPVMASGDPTHQYAVPVNVVAGGAGGGAVTVADGADVAEGATTDAAVTTNAAGTISAKLRGLVALLAQAFSLGTPLRVDPTGGTTQPVSLVAGSAIAGKVGIDQTTPGTTNAVADTAATAGGLSIYAFLSTAAVQAAAIKASAGQVYALHFFNSSGTICYLRLYNQTTSPGSGDTPVYRALIPANTNGAGFVVAIPPGIVFGTGIGIRVTAAVADNDNTALAANAILGNVFYK